MFWFDYPNLNPTIMKADMAGEMVTHFVHTAVGYVDSIVLNPSEQKMYWLDYNRQSVSSIGYTGTNKYTYIRVPGNGMTGLTLSMVCNT